MKSRYKIVSLLLIVAVFAFNLVLLPAQAEDGCHCDHPRGEEGYDCCCKKSSQKPTCDIKGTSLTKRQCGTKRHSNDFSIPANEHPTLISVFRTDLNPHLSTLKIADSSAITGVDPLSIEHPPSVL